TLCHPNILLQLGPVRCPVQRGKFSENQCVLLCANLAGEVVFKGGAQKIGKDDLAFLMVLGVTDNKSAIHFGKRLRD
ncbi:MAG: hypothetical protein WAM97_19170, partial [Acidimicrobiales bacterium]